LTPESNPYPAGTFVVSNKLHCAACGRTAGTGPDEVQPVLYLEMGWCPKCARIGRSAKGLVWVDQPSPGHMIGGPIDDVLEAWRDCYVTIPKRRIKVADAKREVQRAWRLWDGEKEGGVAMLMFFAWLQRHRPYFLTFRYNGDRWQRVHSWLLQSDAARTKRRA
jgi:hypothetical protein